jgi:hypothetical protein
MTEEVKKVCTKCREEKSLNEFYVRRVSRDGLTSKCKKCKTEYAKQGYIKYIDRIKVSGKTWRDNNLQKRLENNKRWKSANPEKYKAAIKNWRLNNKERTKNTAKIWYIENIDRVRENGKKWNAKNIDRVRASRRRASEKIRSTPKGKINNCMVVAINRKLNGSKHYRRWLSLVDFTIPELIRHLERQFKLGMTWENQGSYWHIDHKIPIAAFNFTTPEDIDFKRCWNLNNLQPLEATENHIKKDKVEIPFQSSLLIREVANG